MKLNGSRWSWAAGHMGNVGWMRLCYHLVYCGQPTFNPGRKETLPPSHPLHATVAKQLSKCCSREYLICAPECGGNENIPLFMKKPKSNATEICNVDALVHDGSSVRLVIEIEESDITPTRVCGKFLTTALACHYISRNRGAMLLRDVTFVQVLESKHLKPRSKKREQVDMIAQRLQTVCSGGFRNVSRYVLLWPDKIEELKHIIDAIRP